MMAVIGCTSNDYVGDKDLLEENIGNGVISFTSNTPAITRAPKEGSAAATDLNNQFYVYAIKNEKDDGAGNVQTGHLVFNNYIVKWVAGSANSTTSNTNSWEYVGYTLSAKEQANITVNSGDVAQTIKYWDYGAKDYTFYAFSALPADISGDKVKVVKKTDATTSYYDNGYTVTLAADADLDHLFFAERQNIEKSDNTDRTQVNKYGGNVTFRFHNMATKVRVAMYETIPGYDVIIKNFSVDNDGTNPAFSDMTDGVTANFAANLQNSVKGAAGTMTVTYVSEGTTQNHPTASFTPTGDRNCVLSLGTNLRENVTIGKTVTEATYDQTGKAYTSVFPNESNEQNMKLKLSYTLKAPVTEETIEIADKTAEVPAQYLQWKSGYAYTYIFKITDDALNPITFDAVRIEDADGQAEYITTVTNPSITTFGVKGGQFVTGKDDYEAGSDIYATFVAGSNVLIPVLSGEGENCKIYSVAYKEGATDAEKADKPINELSVANAIANTGGLITATDISGATATYFDSAPSVVTSVPTEDGRTRDIKALKLTGVKAGTYAVELTHNSVKYYKVIKVV